MAREAVESEKKFIRARMAELAEDPYFKLGISGTTEWASYQARLLKLEGKHRAVLELMRSPEVAIARVVTEVSPPALFKRVGLGEDLITEERVDPNQRAAEAFLVGTGFGSMWLARGLRAPAATSGRTTRFGMKPTSRGLVRESFLRSKVGLKRNTRLIPVTDPETGIRFSVRPDAIQGGRRIVEIKDRKEVRWSLQMRGLAAAQRDLDASQRPILYTGTHTKVHPRVHREFHVLRDADLGPLPKP